MDNDVIVVGAGPVGLLLAAELKLAGAQPVVLEARHGLNDEKRARGIGPLATEALRRRGLGEEIARHDAQGRADFARDHGSDNGHFASIHKIDPALQDEPGRERTLIWQPELEKILVSYATGLGVPIRYGHQVTDLGQDEAGVTVTVTTSRGDLQLRSSYLAGCDGGRSTVRELVPFDFPGTAPIMTVRRAAARIEDTSALPPPGRNDRGTLFYGGGMVATFDFEDTERRRGPISAEELEASVRRVSGADVTITEVGAGLRFTDQARQAGSYRLGRVLLAGDAAHVHSPSGGQGLNLGLLDAVNLGWKLAATVAGTAPAGLLDSYHHERHPAGAEVLHNTRAQSALLRPGPHSDALRDIVADLMDIPEVNRYFGRMLSGLGLRHDFPYPATHPLTGRPCPDLELSLPDGGTTRLYDLTHEGGPIMLHPAPASPWTGFESVAVTSTGRNDLAAALVRPDGIVAWAAAPGQPDDATRETALRTWIGDSRQRTSED
ncbi:FAD-dependent monooxygenase [Amycolatopsis sp. NPDC059027]|uniref:FAD-dependent monooxygenase n=1 Tax=unclassified Amycolatopsis TaxID=2618356 RepID=UPI00366F6C7B